MQRLAALLSIALLVMLVACGGSSGGNNNVVPPVTQVKLNMTTASTLVGPTQQFTANVPVTWTVKEANGGAITSDGLYTAPKDVGVFHVVATSKVDTTQSATASVDVSAKFLSLQKLPNGTATPYSVTPVMNTLKSDAQTFTSNVLNDPTTQAPFDTNAFDIMISPDGTKAVTSTLVEAPFQGELAYFYDLVVASADGSTLTQITHNEDIQTEQTWDVTPSWSSDGKMIVDMHAPFQ